MNLKNRLLEIGGLSSTAGAVATEQYRKSFVTNAIKDLTQNLLKYLNLSLNGQSPRSLEMNGVACIPNNKTCYWIGFENMYPLNNGDNDYHLMYKDFATAWITGYGVDMRSWKDIPMPTHSAVTFSADYGFSRDNWWYIDEVFNNDQLSVKVFHNHDDIVGNEVSLNLGASDSLYNHQYGEAHFVPAQLLNYEIGLGILAAVLWGLRAYYFYKNRHAIKEVATDLKNGAVNFFRNKVFDREQYRGLKNASYLFNNLSI